jgi:hypothetical protein
VYVKLFSFSHLTTTGLFPTGQEDVFRSRAYSIYSISNDVPRPLSYMHLTPGQSRPTEIVLVFRVRIRKYDRGRCWLVVASCRSYTIDLSTEQRSSHSYEMVQVYLPISAHFLAAAASDPDLRELQCTGPCSQACDLPRVF